MSKKAKVHNWEEVAARNILNDLGGRSGISNALDECDSGVMSEITASIVAIIRKAHSEAVKDANTTF